MNLQFMTTSLGEHLEMAVRHESNPVIRELLADCHEHTVRIQNNLRHIETVRNPVVDPSVMNGVVAKETDATRLFADLDGEAP